MVNTSQQVGGSIGVALLSTIEASAAASALAPGKPTSEAILTAAVHGYTTAFYWAGGIFVLAAIAAWSLFRAKARPAAPGTEPATEPS